MIIVVACSAATVSAVSSAVEGASSATASSAASDEATEEPADDPIEAATEEPTEEASEKPTEEPTKEAAPKKSKFDSLSAEQQDAYGSAQDYLESQGFSKQGLIDQLESDYGSQFTHSQAVYGAKHSR